MSVRVGAVFSEPAHFFLFKILTLLSLVVIVWYIHQLVLHLDGQGLHIFFTPKFVVSMCKMAAVTLRTVAGLHKMLANLGLK